MSDRTFKLTSPLMEGRDVAYFQETLNERFRQWDVDCRLDVDGGYGTHTREATRRVLYGLGIPARDLDHGVTPELRILLRHPERRTPAQKALAHARKDWLRRLRKRYEGHGAAAALAYARKHLGVTENPPNSNRGRLIDQWQRMCDVIAAPWCGCFTNACLVAAGFPAQPWLRYCPWIEGRARSGDGGWSWHSATRAKPGDLVLFGGSIAQHVEIYAGDGVTYGGNTSSGPTGPQANGGGVFARRRNFSDPAFPARGVARPPYRGS
jgi:hypothetical protein